ncbi:MAG: hypothetical protein RSD36_17850 [Terrisporobacter sp.]
MTKQRGLSDKFIKDLKCGILKPILDVVKIDDSLCLEIRDNYINIYYRGGSLYKIEPINDRYKFTFNVNYLKTKKNKSNTNKLDCMKNQINSKIEDFSKKVRYEELINLTYELKREMDLWFYENHKNERECQQIVLRENNNSSISQYTDYYIVDIEYADNMNSSRFDLIAVKYDTSSPDMEKPYDLNLVIIEMKYGDKSLCGSSGILEHFKQIESFINMENRLNSLYDEVEIILNQKIELDLIRGIKKTLKFNRSIKPEYIILIVNHNPKSTILKRELKNAMNIATDIKKDIDIKVATVSNLGYSLYSDNMIDIDNYLKRV